MQVTVDANSYFVFDLDDTLFYEIDYLKSAYRHIAKALAAHTGIDLYDEMLARFYKSENVFEWLLNNLHFPAEISKGWLLQQYRGHLPDITLQAAVKAFLGELKQHQIPIGLITDGRSITQRNKLKALGIEQDFTDIIISEEFGSQKPDERNYLFFEKKYSGKNFYFFGDNTGKDFIVPAKLGWASFCIKNNGTHIHLQELSRLHDQCHVISSFAEIHLNYINQ
ncbi:HAD family hydrolase [Ilyomonas limi]|uniref:HAD family hydrolase n=1 Tax=Ilyomonas limi TaxID=2575867 RepID=A0A4U3KRP4_9BACT|nr:HAD family hydrolase [Ilyomonas limi]TKK65018.1 HAD family hydrolase [Ilyomonas limi]